MSLAFDDQRILVVAAHPDDEVLGPGASVHRWVTRHGCTAHALILGEGLTSRSEKRDTAAWANQLAMHKRHAEAAGTRIGYASVQCHDVPDNRFDTVALLDLVKLIEAAIEDIRPDVILTHHHGDTNIDHQRTFEAVIVATRPVPGSPLRTILSFEIPSSTEWQAPTHPEPFRPSLVVRLDEADLQAKIEAMEAYAFERRPYPHPRSPEALRILAQQRGLSVGAPLAEAFQFVRSIV